MAQITSLLSVLAQYSRTLAGQFLRLVVLLPAFLIAGLLIAERVGGDKVTIEATR